MTYEEAFSAAILGERVRAVDMPEGVYIDYQFAGLRINFPSGSSSGWHATDRDKAVEWEIWTKPEPTGWDMTQVKPSKPEPVKRRRSNIISPSRASFVPPAVTEETDIDWQKPLEPGPVKMDPPAKVPTDSVSNGWAIFDENKGVDKPEKDASGWPVFSQGN